MSTEKGIIAHGTIISHSLLLKISQGLANSDRHYRKNNNANQRRYKIARQLDDKKLSVREWNVCFI